MIDPVATDKGTGSSAHTQKFYFIFPHKLAQILSTLKITWGVLANLPQVIGQCTDC